MISNNTCPPGVICINNTNAIGIIAVFLIIIYVINKENYKSLYDKVNFLQNKQNNHEQHLLSNVQNQVQGMVMAPEKSDYNMEVIKNPLYPQLITLLSFTITHPTCNLLQEDLVETNIQRALK